MMTKLREMTFIFIWILVIAFVGLMVFEWGMDITGIKGRSNVVGKIAGRKINIQDFQRAIQSAYIQERERTGQAPDEDRIQQLRDEVWNEYVQSIILGDEIKRLGIKVSPREIYLYIMENPPQDITQNPNFQTDGKFDIRKWQEAVRNAPKDQLIYLEDRYRQQIAYMKLQNLISNSVIVTEEEIKDEYIRQNQKIKLEFLQIPFAAFSQEDVSVSDEELKSYYEAHKEDYKVPEKRSVKYVIFSTLPTKQDTARIWKLAEDLIRDAKNGVDFKELADEFSEDPSVKTNHGDLGYFDRKSMVKPFADAAFAGKPGDIVGPVKTQFGIHVIKIIDKKKEKGVEKVHAAHILLKYSPSAKTIQEARDAADNFHEYAQDEGFEKAAEQLHVTIHEIPDFPKQGYVPGLGALPNAAKWVFQAKVNEVSRVFQTERGYVVFELTKITPPTYRSFEEVKNAVAYRVKMKKRKELTRKLAEEIASKVKQGIPFKTIAEEYKAKQVKADTTGTFTLLRPIPKIGRSPEIVAAALELEVGKVSGILEAPNGYYFIKVLYRDPFNEADYKSKRLLIRNQLLSQKRQQFFSQWYEKLKEKAEIEDYRDRFFM